MQRNAAHSAHSIHIWVTFIAVTRSKSVLLGHGQGEKSHRIVHSIPKQKCKAEIFAPLIPPTLPLSLPRSLRWCLPGCLRAIGGSPPRRPFLPLRPSATPRRPPVGPPTWKPIIRRTMRSPPRRRRRWRRRLRPDERTDEALMGMEDERSLAPSVDLPARSHRFPPKNPEYFAPNSSFQWGHAAYICPNLHLRYHTYPLSNIG